MQRFWVILPLVLLLLAGAPMPATAAEDTSREPGFAMGLGDRGALHVRDDGSFSLRNGDNLPVNASHWTVRVDDRAIAPGTEAYRKALVAPLHYTGDTLAMVFYDEGVLTEIAYRAAGGTAVLTVTTVNRWLETANVTFRCALHIQGLGLWTCQTGLLRNETAFSPGAFTHLAGLAGGTEAFSCVIPVAPEAVKAASSPAAVLDSEWHVGVNGAIPLGEEAGVAVFWPQLTILPGEFYRVRLLLSAGPPEAVAVPQSDISMDQLGVDPVTAHENDARRVVFSVASLGPSVDLEATVLFMLEGIPFSTVFCPLRLEWNRTVWTQLDWNPATAGNYTVVVLLPLADDRSPADNLLAQAADVRVDPYEFTLRFSTSEHNSTYSSFPGARFKVQLYVRNTGVLPDSYDLSLKGVPEGWKASLSSANMSLEAGKLSYFWLTVQPSERARNGSYGIQIRALSGASGEMRRVNETVEIGPPPPPGNYTAPAGYQRLPPGNGSNPPPVEIRPYPPPDTSGAGWFAQGDRSRLAFSALGVLAVAAAAAFLGVALYQASRAHAISVFRRIIKRALYGLATGDELRLVIYETYKRMCAHLEKLDYTREDHVTPTEFARALRLALPLDTQSIRMLTELFEEARYSNHRLGDSDRQAAIECLRHVESELDKLTTFVDEEPRMARLKRRLGMGEA